jgi:hypothetical protein
MSKRKLNPARTVVVLLTVIAALTLGSSIATAQETTPRAEFFAGYSWMTPGGDVAAPGLSAPFSSATPRVKLDSLPSGWGTSLAVNFNRWFGIQVDGGGHWDRGHNSSVMAGPKFSIRGDHFSPFAEVMGGWSRLSAGGAAKDNGFGALAGGGIDMYLTRHIALRIIQADYFYQAHKVRNLGGDGTFHGARVQGGLVLGFGSVKPPVAPTAACSLQPTAVLAGEPITATVTTTNFNPKHTVSYEWKSTGGKVAPSNTTAKIDTTGLNPGSYTVTATATDPKAPKGYQTATCNASFTINEPPKHPPTISCSANPATVRSGDPSTITCQGNSPDNRPLTYACQPSAGRISGNGPSFTLDTAGAPAGSITVNCTVTDDRGLSARTSTSVNVEVPPPPPQASKIGEIVFPNKAKPWRVDNTAKAILDDVALRLQREANAKAVIVGYFDPSEKGGMKLAEQRAVNTKAYLTQEKGIDPSRIEVRTGTAGGNRAEIYLVPAGATFNVAGTQTFNESAVKPITDRRPAPAKRKAGKKAAPAAKPKQ